MVCHFCVPPRANKILGLDLARTHLTFLCTLLDLPHEGLLLLLEFDSLLIKLADCLVQEPLVLPQPLSGRDALAERPLEDLDLSRLAP